MPTINVFSLREFDFSGGNGTVVAAKEIPVDTFTEGVLLVRIHSNSTSAGTGQIDVRARTIALSGEDPAVVFVETTDAALVVVDEAAVDAAPKLKKTALSAGFAGALQVQVAGTKGTSTTVKAVLSADLVMKA